MYVYKQSMSILPASLFPHVVVVVARSTCAAPLISLDAVHWWASAHNKVYMDRTPASGGSRSPLHLGMLATTHHWHYNLLAGPLC